jgi:ADP-dependent NAD(P)H-hydrate dehydratase / NAD(P)H-hydrate epimerase
MLKILSAAQIRELDAYTIKHEPIASIDLMERACQEFTNRFRELFDQSHTVSIVCGTGNNGGDGLGIARLLHESRYTVQLIVIRGEVAESPDFSVNFSRLPSEINLQEVKHEPDINNLDWGDIIIDGIFGSGLSREPEGIYAEVINLLNETDAFKIAIDIPSGLFADKPTTSKVIFTADLTLSFQLPKLSFLIPDYADQTGDWELLDIGLHKKYIQAAATDYCLTTIHDIKSLVSPRANFSHKGDYGKALLLVGSKGKMGAAILAAKAAMRSGLGLLTAHIAACGYSSLQTAVPECMTSTDEQDEHISRVKLELDFDAIGIGPGLGTHQDTVSVLQQVLSKYNKPVVLDADALNIIAVNSNTLHLIPKGSILTPHPKEFERLAGNSSNGFEQLQKLKEFAKACESIVVLKGSFTAIADANGKIFFNSSGNPGMATGGSGDVLTGIITALLAKGLASLDAARLGVYLHGLAADIAVAELGEEALIASDIIGYLPQAWIKLYEQ